MFRYKIALRGGFGPLDTNSALWIDFERRSTDFGAPHLKIWTISLKPNRGHVGAAFWASSQGGVIPKIEQK